MPNRSTFKTHEEYLKWFQEYRDKHRKKIRKYNRLYIRMWRKKNGYKNEINSKLKFPKKNKARILAQKALKAGKIKKHDCAKCGSKKSQMHHPNYNKPLKVIWLCALCHTKMHSKSKK